MKFTTVWVYIVLWRKPYHRLHVDTKMRSHAIKDFFRKCDQIYSFLRIWSLKSLIKNFIFCTVFGPNWNCIVVTCGTLVFFTRVWMFYAELTSYRKLYRLEFYRFVDMKWLISNPVDTGRKLNVHKTFRRRLGRLLNVLYTFNLSPVSTGKPQKKKWVKEGFWKIGLLF